ncbi:TetR/AcrR family transcriptional regulator [Tropicibacter oceani]|uniref:TetR/AcrR family transcriptional regulator n=1 Tax=Tropicibacter oceani TaxID=3058420 RepID=A0ABY8QHV7_9RHOB|nr:TetR/AcrR family transcriptional regulator [Tropicibacter oceani]WGW04200.1 TetR/AcrR family transcriptional regulator [Tropicibacter oceani]
MTTEAVVRKGRKYDQVLEGARDIFLRDGFEGASVDDIARAAGVSKATLYSYFPDKRLLFMEVATDQCTRQAEEALGTMDFSKPPRTVLKEAARRFLSFIYSDMGQRIFRICVAESDRFPELGRQFYQSGPQTVHRALVAYLAQAQARGEVSIDDLNLAADQFAELCKADLWPKLIFGIQVQFDQADVDRIVDGAIDTFMARYET